MIFTVIYRQEKNASNRTYANIDHIFYSTRPSFFDRRRQLLVLFANSNPSDSRPPLATPRRAAGGHGSFSKENDLQLVRDFHIYGAFAEHL